MYPSHLWPGASPAGGASRGIGWGGAAPIWGGSGPLRPARGSQRAQDAAKGAQQQVGTRWLQHKRRRRKGGRSWGKGGGRRCRRWQRHAPPSVCTSCSLVPTAVSQLNRCCQKRRCEQCTTTALPYLCSCSAQKKEQVAAGVTAAAMAVLANPLAAEAAGSPSLNNLLGSLVAGGLVLAAIATAITAVS